MNNGEIIQRLELLTNAIQEMAKAMGTRLTRAQLLDRLGVHRNILPKYLVMRGFPKPCKDGKWLLSEIIEWERNSTGGRS